MSHQALLPPDQHQMPFQTRNPYYLRISDKNVLPLYVYLDERHLDWMSDLVLQHVLSDLRPHILPKLKTETSILQGSATSKKGTVDTHRGETYQFCYFFRKTEPHSVVVKTRNFVALPPQKRSQMPPPPVPSSSKPQRGKRKAKVVSERDARKKRKTKGKGKARDEESEQSMPSSSDSDSDFNPFNPPQSRRPRQATKTPARGHREEDNDNSVSDPTEMSAGQAIDIDMTVSSANRELMDIDTAPEPEVPSASAMAPELELEEEEKPKPMLQLRYQGFGIYGHCLCVVVEPWPPIRFTSKAPSTIAPLPTLSREPSLAPQSFRRASEQPGVERAKTPLFLPDDFDRGDTPAPFRGQSVTPASSFFDPRFLEDSDSEEDDGGMMLFSQVLNNAGDSRAGAANDDEDDNMPTGMFFGDADEAREL